MYRQQNIVSLRHNVTRPINAFSVQRRSPTVITNFFKPYQSANGSPQKQEKVQEEEQVAIPEVDAKNVLHMAPDTLTAYRQAQANMQQLNNSRIIAVEELKSARKKIKELEVKLKEAEERAKTALQQNTQQVTSSSVTVQEAETVFSFEEEQEVDQISTDQGLLVDEEEVKEEEEVVQPENVVVEEEQEVVVQPENVVAEEEIEQEEEEEEVAEEEEQQEQEQSKEVKTDTIQLLYYSGWHEAHLHFNADNKGWTDPPGWHMAAEYHDGNNVHQLKLECCSIEFVLNNGQNDWDTPAPETKKQNYTINTPGVYKLESGVVQKLS